MSSRIGQFGSVLASAVLISVVMPIAASAATINVTTTVDEYTPASAASCSLREAIESANTGAFIGCTSGEAGNDTIVLPAGTYPIAIPAMMPLNNSTGDFNVAGTATVQPQPGAKVVIDAALQDRAFTHAGSGTLTFSNLTIRRANSTGVDGGAIFNDVGSTLVLNGVTLDSNSTSGRGGGLANVGGTATLTNSTLVGNRASGSGGGIYASAGGTTTLRNVTIASNTADLNGDTMGEGGGIAITAATVNAFNSVIADNADLTPSLSGFVLPDCSSNTAAFAPRYTLIESVQVGFCSMAADPGTNIFGQDPNLGALADNGGQVPTVALNPGSIAIDKGGLAAPDLCEGTDQRGVARPQGTRCDLGAFERAPADDPPVVPPVTPPVTPPTSGKCAGKTATTTGTAKRDVIKGTAKRDIVAALGGNDKVTGLGGNDLICGGGGNDTVDGGQGNDTLKGEAGKDTLRGGAGKDILQGAKGVDKLFGGPAKDKLAGGPGKDQQKQ